MSGNGAFAKANGILSGADAIATAAEYGQWAIDLADKSRLHEAGGYRWSLLKEAEKWAAISAGLAAYAEALVKVRGT